LRKDPVAPGLRKKKEQRNRNTVWFSWGMKTRPKLRGRNKIAPMGEIEKQKVNPLF